MRLVYDISHGAPYTERIALAHPYFRIIGIGRDEPSFSSALLKAFQGVFAIELAHGHFVGRGAAVALVHYDTVARADASIYHGTAFHTDEIR